MAWTCSCCRWVNGFDPPLWGARGRHGVWGVGRREIGAFKVGRQKVGAKGGVKGVGNRETGALMGVEVADLGWC